MDNFQQCLLLYHRCEQLVDTEQLVGLLRQHQFIGKQQSDHFYVIGEKFNHLLMFMGCSPTIHGSEDTGAGSDNAATRVAVQILSFEHKIFYCAKERLKFCCRVCKKYASVPRVNHFIQESSHFSCPHCHQSYAYEQFNWRKQAAVGKQFIQIHGIFPSEAIPSDRLLTLLQQLNQSPWFYCYVLDHSAHFRSTSLLPGQDK